MGFDPVKFFTATVLGWFRAIGRGIVHLVEGGDEPVDRYMRVDGKDRLPKTDDGAALQRRAAQLSPISLQEGTTETAKEQGLPTVADAVRKNRELMVFTAEVPVEVTDFEKRVEELDDKISEMQAKVRDRLHGMPVTQEAIDTIFMPLVWHNEAAAKEINERLKVLLDLGKKQGWSEVNTLWAEDIVHDYFKMWRMPRDMAEWLQRGKPGVFDLTGYGAPHDLGGTIDQIKQYYDFLLLGKGFKLVFEKIPVELQEKHLGRKDWRQLRRILTNFLTNAIKYHHPLLLPGERWIKVHISLEGENVHLRVSDNGRGMMPQFAADWGRERWRDPAVEREGIPGEGKGSESVRRLVEKDFGGKLVVTSALGQGSTFDTYIPVEHLFGQEVADDLKAGQAMTSLQEMENPAAHKEMQERIFSQLFEALEKNEGKGELRIRLDRAGFGNFAEAELILDDWDTLKGFNRITELDAFVRQAHAYNVRVIERIVDILAEDGPDVSTWIETYAGSTRQGPMNFVERIFDRNFLLPARQAGVPEAIKAVGIAAHDSFKLFGIMHHFTNRTLLSIFSARLEWFVARRREQARGLNVRRHVLYSVFPYTIGSAMSLTPFSVDVEIPEGLHFREGVDIDEVTAVLSELGNNALKYRDWEKPEGYFRIRRDAPSRAFIAEDNGTGIIDKEGVWEMGGREGDRHVGVPGTGLGLALVRQRIEKLGWTITIDPSLGAGQGTRFIITPKPGDIIDPAVKPSGPDSAASTYPQVSDTTAGVSSAATVKAAVDDAMSAFSQLRAVHGAAVHALSDVLRDEARTAESVTKAIALYQEKRNEAEAKLKRTGTELEGKLDAAVAEGKLDKSIREPFEIIFRDYLSELQYDRMAVDDMNDALKKGSWRDIDSNRLQVTLYRFGSISELFSRYKIDGILQGGLLDMDDIPEELRRLGIREEARKPLEGIIENILSNAVDHRKPLGVPGMPDAILRVYPSGLNVVIESADSGVGMSGEAGAGGEGLRLKGVREIAEELGGRVEVESEPGEGSTVRAIIPLSRVVELNVASNARLVENASEGSEQEVECWKRFMAAYDFVNQTTSAEGDAADPLVAKRIYRFPATAAGLLGMITSYQDMGHKAEFSRAAVFLDLDRKEFLLGGVDDTPSTIVRALPHREMAKRIGNWAKPERLITLLLEYSKETYLSALTVLLKGGFEEEEAAKRFEKAIEKGFEEAIDIIVRIAGSDSMLSQGRRAKRFTVQMEALKKKISEEVASDDTVQTPPKKGGGGPEGGQGVGGGGEAAPPGSPQSGQQGAPSQGAASRSAQSASSPRRALKCCSMAEDPPTQGAIILYGAEDEETPRSVGPFTGRRYRGHAITGGVRTAIPRGQPVVP